MDTVILRVKQQAKSLAPTDSMHSNSNGLTVGSADHKGQIMSKILPMTLEIMLTFENCACSWCTEELGVGDGIVLQDCCHPYCRYNNK